MNLLIILLCIIILLVISNIIFIVKMLKYRGQVYQHNYESTLNNNRMSMIEYTYRKYKEGQNPFTTLREISNILKYLD